MAGGRHTLLRRLLLALLPALLGLAALGAALDYLQVRHMADSAYDQSLASIAIGLAARLESERDNDLPLHLAALAGGDGQRRFVVLAEDGRILAGEPQLAALAAADGAGPDAGGPVFADVEIGGQALRAVRMRYAGPDGNARIAVTESLDARRAAARRALRTTAWTNLLMIVAVLAAVTLGVRAALVPLHRLGTRASRHDVDRLQPLDGRDVPQEVLPLVDGINHLIARLREALQAEQAFLSASAHQLRTPLAGLQAQLDVLLDEARGAPLHGRLLALRGPVQRLTRLTEQMLALARTEAGTPDADGRAEMVDLVALLQEIASERLDASIARQVDLGLDTTPASVPGLRWMLREMLANLVDNALRYAPVGSEVTLRCGTGPQPEAAWVEVEDAGPGIPAHERERVFERFVRLSDADRTGTGLGLAIVREVARQHGAAVQVGSGAGGRGTCMRIVLPAGAAAERGEKSGEKSGQGR